MYSVLQDSVDPALLVLDATLVMGCAGIPGLFLKRPGPGQAVAALCTTLAALVGIATALKLLFSGTTASCSLAWNLPFGSCELAIDPLSALFLIPVFLVTAAGSLFAVGYWPAVRNRRSEPGLTFFYGILGASMALVLLARNTLFFMMVWEVMALSAYFLIVTEHEREEVRRAGIIYLLATHCGTALLLLFFSLLAARTGSFLLPATGSLSALTPLAPVMAVAALIGFGAKAGLMPLHFWLPPAHANAPSHVSALMSGVMLKMGIYGILRSASFFYDIPLLWGTLLTIVGLTSALLGIAFALAQRDLKRLLACSSIENIGIITIGTGVALVGAASQSTELVYLGAAGALLHVLNHSLFKPLLFLGSGVIIHATGTRDMNLMGGLGKTMPRIGGLFLVGTVAICGIPPLNGFVSEFLLYLGFFSQIQGDKLIYLMGAAPLLALVGGLAVLTFTKLYSSVFLGTPRSLWSGHRGGELPMGVPMALFALLCLLIGVVPQTALSLVSSAVTALFPRLPLSPLAVEYGAILEKLSLAGVLLLTIVLVITLLWRWRLGREPVTAAPTWGCGYQRGTSRMQYGATSFSELAVSIGNGVLGQRIGRPLLTGLFPERSECSDLPSETLLDRIIAPFLQAVGIAFAFLRRLQNGLMHIYVLYIFATLFILMLWAH